MKYSFLLIGMLVFSGCVTKPVEVETVKPPVKKIDILDLVFIPQNIEYYTNQSDFNNTSKADVSEYEKFYFSPWNTEEPLKSLEESKWAFKAYKVGKSYGENLKPLEQGFFDEMSKNANFENFSSINKRAITLNHLNIRAFPTKRPLLYDPKKAGEGFPFDYLQNTTIQANKPVFISHYSLDGEWAHIYSSFAYGWVSVKDIVLLEKQYTDRWQDAKQVFITQEGESIFSENGNFLFKSKIGTMLPLIGEDEDNYTVLAVSTYKANKALYEKAKIPKQVSNKGPLEFNKDNLEKIVKEVSKTNYGWGGLYSQRDCSSMLRDLYAPFAVWLPRNSYQQSQVGEHISFEGLNSYQKIALIKEKAVPFKTLLYKRGHIMLYVGLKGRSIIVFHNTWGIKTLENEKEGRTVIGKPIYSTLKLGKEQRNFDADSELLKNLKSMNILDF